MKNLYLLTSLICFAVVGHAQNWNEIVKISAPDRGETDYFGWSLDMDGEYAIAGSFGNPWDAAGNDSLKDAGAAYMLQRDILGNWKLVHKISASDRAQMDQFGFSVAISGNTAVVGAKLNDFDTIGADSLEDAGAAYIFERDSSGNWIEIQKIISKSRRSDDAFGQSVAIDGDHIIVGAKQVDWDTAGVVNLSNAGAAYLFERDGNGIWNEVQMIVASDRFHNSWFGYAVAIEGDYAVVGAQWDSRDSIGGGTLSRSGSAYTFLRDGNGIWNEVQKITAGDRSIGARFGVSLDISGTYVIVGAYQDGNDSTGGNFLQNAGSAYLFERNANDSLIQIQKFIASDRAAEDNYGFSVAISGTTALVGSRQHNADDGGSIIAGAGAAYTYVQDGSGAWSETQILKASDKDADDWFGYSLAISGEYIIVCAINDEHDASGGNPVSSAGSVYIFRECSLDTAVSQDGQTLTAAATGVFYQWLDCDNGYSPISGANDQIFTAPDNGSYAVEIGKNGCGRDTSACFAVIGVGISDDSFGSSLNFYPNPTTGLLTIDLGDSYQRVEVNVFSSLGQHISSESFGGTDRFQLDIAGDPGLYFVSLRSADGHYSVLKVIHE